MATMFAVQRRMNRRYGPRTKEEREADFQQSDSPVLTCTSRHQGVLVAALCHPRFILERRKVLRSERRVPDREVMEWMTAHMTNGESTLGRGVNAIARGYCRLVGLRTIERLPAGSR